MSSYDEAERWKGISVEVWGSLGHRAVDFLTDYLRFRVSKQAIWYCMRKLRLYEEVWTCMRVGNRWKRTWRGGGMLWREKE